MPPVKLTVRLPSDPPLQLTWLAMKVTFPKAVGSIMSMQVSTLQPFRSVAVTQLLPAARPVAVAVVAPVGDHV